MELMTRFKSAEDESPFHKYGVYKSNITNKNNQSWFIPTFQEKWNLKFCFNFRSAAKNRMLRKANGFFDLFPFNFNSQLVLHCKADGVKIALLPSY